MPNSPQKKAELEERERKIRELMREHTMMEISQILNISYRKIVQSCWRSGITPRMDRYVPPPDFVERIRELSKTKSMAQISRELGCSAAAIRKACLKNGIACVQGDRWANMDKTLEVKTKALKGAELHERNRKIVDLAEDHTIDEISEIIGTSYQTAQLVLFKAGVKAKVNNNTQSKEKTVELEEREKKVRELAESHTVREIAQILAINQYCLIPFMRKRGLKAKPATKRNYYIAKMTPKIRHGMMSLKFHWLFGENLNGRTKQTTVRPKSAEEVMNDLIHNRSDDKEAQFQFSLRRMKYYMEQMKQYAKPEPAEVILQDVRWTGPAFPPTSG